jgi:hypothetical protein
MTRDERIAIGVGGVHGLVLFVVVAAMALEETTSWPLIAIAIVLGVAATWRGAVYVRRFLAATVSLYQPLRDGFLLLFLSALVYLVPNLLVAHAHGAQPQGWGWPFWRAFLGAALGYSLIVGVFGALVGFVLGIISAAIASWFRPLDPAMIRLRKRRKARTA